MPTPRQWTLTATILGSSLTFIDATVVNVALPALQTGLNATMTEVQWVIESYALLLGALILVGGSMGDQFGRKRVFLSGVVLFAVASVLCGLAGSVSALIVARAVQGAGAALLVPGSLAIISASFDDAERGRAIGTWSGFSAITAATGPVLGGWLIEHVSWRAVFLINVPIAIAVVILAARFVSESRDPSRRGAVDWTGASLAATGLGGIVFALLEWPRVGLLAFSVLAGSVVGVMALAGFTLVERRSANPMLPFQLFRSKTFTHANALTLFLYAALNIVFFIVPLNLIQVQHYTPTESGAALLPFPLIMFALSRWSGGLVARVGSRLPLTLGPIVAAVGLALFARPSIGGSYWATTFPAVVILGFGMALVVAPLTATVMDAVAREHAGAASGVNNAVARVAGLLSIALFGVVMVRTFDRAVARSIDTVGLSAAERATVDRELPKIAGAQVDRLPLDARRQTVVRRAIDDAFVLAFRVVMIGAATLALAAALIGAAIRQT